MEDKTTFWNAANKWTDACWTTIQTDQFAHEAAITDITVVNPDSNKRKL